MMIITQKFTGKIPSSSILAISIAFAMSGMMAHAATIEVGVGKAYAQIQGAINAASDGDTVLVYPGTYDRIEVNPRTGSPTIKNLRIISTYEQANPPTLDELDEAAGDCSGTGGVISSHAAYIIENTIIDGSKPTLPTVTLPAVSYNGKEDATSELAGFTIINGYHLVNQAEAPGGGISGGPFGGAAGNANGRGGSQAYIHHNIIRDNVGGEGINPGKGGGIAACSGIISTNVICYNRSGTGAGIAICGGAVDPTGGSSYPYPDSWVGPLIENNIIRNNYSTGTCSTPTLGSHGGAIGDIYYATIRGNKIYDNECLIGAQDPKGAIWEPTACIIEDNLIYGNNGGGIYDSRHCVIRNNVIFDNDGGGGIFNAKLAGGPSSTWEYSPTRIENNTIWGNEGARNSGAAINIMIFGSEHEYDNGHDYEPEFYIRNNILWDNDTGSGANGTNVEFYAQQYVPGAPDTDGKYSIRYHLEYNLIDDSWSDTNTPSLNRFENNNSTSPAPTAVDSNPAGGFDLSLSSGSSGIDDGMSLPSVRTDIEGVARPQDGDNDSTASYDQGAYEFVHSSVGEVERRAYKVQNASGDVVFQIWEDGVAEMDVGFLNEDASEGELEDDSSGRDFIVSDGTDNLARIDLDEKRLYLKGDVSVDQTSLTESSIAPEFIVKSNDGTVQALIDDSGNLKLRGKFYIFGQVHDAP